MTDYQYCPGHARKLKKARREQRMRQQSSYRAARSCSGGADVATKGHKNGVKCGGNNMDDPITKVNLSACVRLSLFHFLSNLSLRFFSFCPSKGFSPLIG